MDAQPPPILKDLVLVGGGHSHIAVLKRFGMRPIPEVQLTLVSRDVHTPYSGMLPGLIAGHYTYDEAHIDLRKLSAFASVRFVHDSVVGLDPQRRLLHFSDRPALPYDLLSLNIGSTPGTGGVPGAEQHAVPVKPISNFLPRWQALLDRVVRLKGRPRIAIVGAGAGGVEMALAMQHRLRRCRKAGGGPLDPEIHVFSDSADILPTHNRSVRRKFGRILDQRAIAVHRSERVVHLGSSGLRTANGWKGTFDEVVWVTRARAERWVAEAGLATDAEGFARVDECLRSISHPNVFAAGDVAVVDPHPRERAGVFAVRQGPPLERNLRRVLLGKAAKPFRPQSKFLGLISTGDQYAVASRGSWSVEGAWAWKWKDWIDRRFMAKYQDLEPMSREEVPGPRVAAGDVSPEVMERDIRCRGCASKVGSTVLTGALASIEPFWRPDVPGGLGARDDAAILEVPPGKILLQSVDFFPAIVDDPFLFGQIAANHALGDIYAMGGDPQSALAVAGIPFGAPDKAENLLRQMLLGANRVFQSARTNLAGGHTSECPELALGFVVNGLTDAEHVLRKGGLRTGDALILTKALGTGVLFAAEMRLVAKGRWIDGAIRSMLQPNHRAAEILRDSGARACTDITGFGLAGHLVEMLESSQVAAEVELEALPALEGSVECLESAVRSSLHPDNRKVWDRVGDPRANFSHPQMPLLFDPQTSGGLLAGVPAEQADECVANLRDAGYGYATQIGEVRGRGPTGDLISAR